MNEIDIIENELNYFFNETQKLYDVSEKEKYKSNLCINCNTDSLTTDFSQGIIVCISCGLIHEENLIDESPEWTSGIEDSISGKDPSRCGCPINPLLEKSSLSTMIGKGGGSKFWLLRKIHQQNSMDYDERARYHIFEEIIKKTDKAQLPESISFKAKYYYKLLSERHLSRGQKRKGLIACCILFACKACQVSRSVKEISNICDLEPKEINSASKIFSHVMSDIITNDNCEKSTDSNDLISRFCNCLNLTHTEQHNVSKIVRNYNTKINDSGILIGKTPSAVTSGIVYFVLRNHNYNVNKKSLCQNHNISIVTLNKIVQILDKNKNIFE